MVDIATLVHGMEAILACLAIMIWHFYEIHFRPHKFPLDKIELPKGYLEDDMEDVPKASSKMNYIKFFKTIKKSGNPFLLNSITLSTNLAF